MGRVPGSALRLLVGSLLLLSGASALGQSSDDWYLDGYRGPYQGRVMDADSRVPLTGVAVVAVWRREIIYPLFYRTEVYRATETVTDDQGNFLLHAKEIEEGAPRWTRRPTFVIFLPRYTVFQGVPEGRFEKPGTTIELRRLKSWQERLGSNSVSPYSLSDYPFRDFPNLMRLFNEERLLRGLKPYEPTEKRPE
jgi:hypothetical protein